MKIESLIKKYIRPTPKYIEKQIIDEDKKHANAWQPGYTRYYGYMKLYSKEIVKITVAVKEYKKKLYMKQVAYHILDSDICLVKDIEYRSYNGFGLRIGWYDLGIQPKGKKWFEQGWCTADDKYYDPYCVKIFNKEKIMTLPEYKYSAADLYNGNEILKYLQMYRENPKIEYIVKTGLEELALTKTILKLCNEDKEFCKWLIKNKEKICKNYYYVTSIIKAYKTGNDIDKTEEIEKFKFKSKTDNDLKRIKDEFKKDLLKLFDYIKEQNTNIYSYSDYLKACQYLNLDMSLPKNRFPHDFKKWHEIRTDEYATTKAKEKEKENAALNEKFVKVAEKYLKLENKEPENYICIIAKSPADLVKEGETLHHCVGRMNYDQKFIREETLIFFVRKTNKPERPFVTLEYSTTTHKVLQCYGENDSRPNDDVLNYVNNTWLPYANKQIKTIAA